MPTAWEQDDYAEFATRLEAAQDWKNHNQDERIDAALEADETRRRARARVEAWLEVYERVVAPTEQFPRGNQCLSYMSPDERLLLDDLKILLYPLAAKP